MQTRTLTPILMTVLAGVGLLAAPACRVNKISRDGPTPRPESVERIDARSDGTPYPSEAVLCSELPAEAKLLIRGAGFSPMPSDLLKDDPGVTLPTVTLKRQGDGVEIVLEQVTFDQENDTLTVRVPPQRLPDGELGPLKPGTYDIVVANPNRNSGTLEAGLVVVPPPVVTGIDPARGPNNVSTEVQIAGSDFREGGDEPPTQPAAVLTPAGDPTAAGGSLESIDYVSEVQVDAQVPPGLAIGWYDLTVTNPEGCSATLEDAFEVVEPAIIELCNTVDPAFGYVDARTTVEICAHNGNGDGLQPVPEAFLMVDPDGDGQGIIEVPLIREAFVSTDAALSVMTAVVPSATEARGAGIVVPDVPGTAYGIKVVNPDGSMGIIPAVCPVDEPASRCGFEVLADRPPKIDAITPGQTEANAGLKPLNIIGSYFKDPTATIDDGAGGTMPLARVLLLAVDPGTGSIVSYDCSSATPAGTAGADGTFTAVTCDVDTDNTPTGSYLVRYQHQDDGSYSDFGAFVITNPAANLETAPVAMQGALNTARVALASSVGRDDLGNRYLYAIGGHSGLDAASALDTVEVAALSRFGFVSSWTELPVRLPQALTGLSVVSVDSYLFALGGKGADAEPVASVYRARVLGADSAPFIEAPAAGTGGALAAGTYSYKVSSLMGPATDNYDAAGGAPGESLPSDAESIRVAGDAAVTLTWQAVPGAVGYRIYRTRLPDQFAGTEQLMREVTHQGAAGAGQSFTDAGADAIAEDAAMPQPAGATGAWMPMPNLAVARADAGATIAVWTDASSVAHHYAYVVGGRTTGGAYLATYDYAELTWDDDAVAQTGAFTTGMDPATPAQPLELNAARAELIVTTLDAQSVPRMGTSADSFVVAATGANDVNFFGDINRARVGPDGALEAWIVPAGAGGSGQSPRWGACGAAANNTVYAISGRSNNFLSKGVMADVCSAGTCNTNPSVAWAGGDSGITLPVPRYRAGFAYASGYFYFIGGQSDATTVLGTVVRGGY